MSESSRTFYAMKTRLGSSNLTIRDKLLSHRLHICPGNVYHNHPRCEILFNRRVKYGHACYVMYWRTHMQEYIAMTAAMQQNTRYR